MNWLFPYFRKLEALLRSRGRTREEAEDLIQEAFLRTKIYCDRGRQVREPEAFLVRAVLNLARDQRALEHRDLYEPLEGEALSVPDLSSDPSELVQAQDRLREIESLLNATSPRTREIFFMHRLDGLSYAQIADHFDVTVSAVEKHIAKAMAVASRHGMRS